MGRKGSGRARFAAFRIAALFSGFVACQNDVPTSVDNGLVPLDPTTVQLLLPFDSFATGAAVFGGFGEGNSAAFGGVLSHVGLNFGDTDLQVRSLARFGALPRATTIQDTTGASVSDSTLSLVSGSLLLTVDTATSVVPDSMSILIERLTEEWAVQSASWTHASRTLGTAVPWSQPGGGATTPVASATWSSDATVDTVRVPLDSATVVAWTDTTDASRGALLRTSTPASRLGLRAVSLTVEMRPSANPDTTVQLAVFTTEQGFIYDPTPTADSTALWVGGSPAWRSVLTLDLPDELNGPTVLCDVVQCPFTLTSDLISSAALILTTVPPPSSFALSDSLRINARTVLAPDRLPKSPVGGALATESVVLGPSQFAGGGLQEIVMPLTSYVRALLDGPGDDGLVPPSTLVLLADFEPSSLGFAAFAGASPSAAVGAPPGPQLRLVLTIPQDAGIR